MEEALAKAVSAPGTADQPVLLRLHRHPQGPDLGDCSAPGTATTGNPSRSTSTRCARPSRRGSSSTCSPTTRPTRPTADREGHRDDPAYERPRPGGPSPGSCRCIPPTWPRRPRSSSSTSGQHTARRSADGQGMVVTSSRLHAVRYKQAIDKLHQAQEGYTDIRPGGLLGQGHRRDGLTYTEPG